MKNFREGKFDRIKTAYLLVKLRDHMTDSLVKDLVHSIAHESRDRGRSHRLAQSLLDINKGFLSKNGETGRATHGLPCILSQDQVINVVSETLKQLGFDLDIKGNELKFMKSIMQTVEGVELGLTEQDSSRYHGVKISAISEDEQGRLSLFVRLLPRSVSVGEQAGARVTIGDGVAFDSLFMQALPKGVNTLEYSRIVVNANE